MPVVTTTAQRSDFISTGRQLAAKTKALFDEHQAWLAEYNAISYGSVNPLVEGDFVGGNAEILPATLVSFAGSLNTLATEYNTGHNTNVNKFKA